jgi:hypothetical protein
VTPAKAIAAPALVWFGMAALMSVAFIGLLAWVRVVKPGPDPMMDAAEAALMVIGCVVFAAAQTA